MGGKQEVIKNDLKVQGWGCRHQQCFILFWVITVAYAMRSCMGVSLVAMTDYNDIDNLTDAAGNGTRKFKIEGILNGLMLVPPYPTFNWSKKIQDAVIASFFWGYMLLQIPAGQLAHRFGARRLLTGAMMINCFMSILMPIVTYYGGWICALMCRVIQGLSQACIVPGIHNLLGKWVPLQERARLAAVVYGGQALGTVLGLPTTGFISSSPLGWPGIFRFYGTLSGIMGILLWYLGADSPAQHAKISAVEKDYIEEDLGSSEKNRSLPVPWAKMFRHKGLYAIIIAHIGVCWANTTLYSEVPAYMDKIMKVNIKANGLLTALPFLMTWFANFFFSYIADWLIVKDLMSVSNVRKLANSIGSIPAAIGLVALAYAPQNIYVVETILIFVCVFHVATHCGFQVNHIDISPNYAGTMMSVSNFISNMGSAIAPLVYGFILTDVSDKYLWRQVFLLAAGFVFVTNLVYVILGTAEKAEWNDPPQKAKDEEESIPILEKPSNLS